ncbi:MAG: hypothetical protein WBR18_13985 [Anaerolineales bacterium]
MKRSWPAAVTLLLALGYVAYRLMAVGGDPVQLAEPGERFQQGVRGGSEGYDGQFALYVALEPNPQRVADQLDVPAYRYQRILLPILARILGLGQPGAIPWTLVLVNLLGHTAGTLALCWLLASHDRWVGYALLYGLWVGVFVGIGTDLHEPLAYGLVAWALWLRSQGRAKWAVGLSIAAMFAKETTLVFPAAFFLADWQEGKLGRTSRWYGLLLAAFVVWQGWLWLTFGQPGVGSGGLMATPFEWIPLMGFWRIAAESLPVFLLYLLLFGPGIIFPALWGIWHSAQDIVNKRMTLGTWPLLLHGLIIMITPYSTFREPLGLVRVATGLTLSIVVVAVVQEMRRPLNYAWFWLAYLVLAR